MCLLVVISRIVADWPLVVAANRDERHDRPADPLGVLRAQAPVTLGGRDRVGGGTWLAVNRAGVVAALTNQPEPGALPQGRSRGGIPLALTAAGDAASAVAAFASSPDAGRYNPCWVLAGDRTSLHYLDLTGERVRAAELPPGLHVLENRAQGEPSAKAEYVRTRLGDVAKLDGDELDARLRELLADHTVNEPAAGDDERSRFIARASACCVHGPLYGTRASSLVRAPAGAAEPPQVWSSDGPSCQSPLVRARWP